MSCNNSYAAAAASARDAMEEEKTHSARVTHFRSLAAEQVEKSYLEHIDECLKGMPEERKSALWAFTLDDYEGDRGAFRNFYAGPLFIVWDPTTRTHNPIEMTDTEFATRLRSAKLMCDYANERKAPNFYKSNPMSVFADLYNSGAKSPEETEETVRFFVEKVAPIIGDIFFHKFGHSDTAQKQFDKYDGLGREAYLAQLEKAKKDI